MVWIQKYCEKDVDKDQLIMEGIKTKKLIY